MIKYSLKCVCSHEFESWFQSALGYDSLKAAGQVHCPLCGSDEVVKALMIPAVNLADKKGVSVSSAEKNENVSNHVRTDKKEAALSAMRAHVEANSEYVGSSFVHESRKIFQGDAPKRSIYGEAPIKEARQLLEDGIPVLPLPFAPRRKMN